MQYTENYSLKLPGYGDNADVGDLNDNTTAIDALIHANRQIEAPAFSTDTAYTTGDMCVYENVLYKFTSDKAAGNWDSTKVTATNLADEVTEAAQSGGTTVIANPAEPATADLHKLQVENTVYGIPDPDVVKEATGNPIEITDGADAPLVKCTTTITGYQEGTGTPSPDNIRPIVAYTEVEIEVSDGDGNTTTHTTTYPSAIYRGSEDVVNGTETHDMIAIDLGSLTWTYSTQYNRFTTTLTGYKKPSSNTVPFNAICSCYETVGSNYTADSSYDSCIGANSGSDTLVVRDTRYTDATAFTSAVTGQTLAYELATPTTTLVTPTNLPIRTLSGYNHIESSTGDMEVEYITQGYQPLVDLIQGSQHVYSTTEQVVGKWVDGKDVYEKTYAFSSLPAVSDWTAFDEDCAIDTLVDYSFMYTRQNGQVDNNPDMLRVAYNPPTGLGDLCYYPGGVGATHITVRYTKSTATTRSLSKGATDSLKADLSEEKKEIEELPETEEKTVKEAQSEGEEVTEKTEEPVEEPTEKEENER